MHCYCERCTPNTQTLQHEKFDLVGGLYFNHAQWVYSLVSIKTSKHIQGWALNPCMVNKHQRQDRGWDISVDAGQRHDHEGGLCNVLYAPHMAACQILIPLRYCDVLCKGITSPSKEISLILHHGMMGCLSKCSNYIYFLVFALYTGRKGVRRNADNFYSRPSSAILANLGGILGTQ